MSSPTPASAASTWTASRSVRWTASTRARTCSSSIRTSASTAAFASRNAPRKQSFPTPRTVLRSGLSSIPTSRRNGPTSRARKTAPPTPTSTRAKRENTINISAPSPAAATEPGHDPDGAGTFSTARRHVAELMNRGKVVRRFACLALAACLSSPALAQDPPAAGQLPTAEEVNTRDTLTIAGGVGITADYEGSDDYRLIPAAAVRGRYHGIAFTTRGAYLYVDVVPRGTSKLDVEFGPAIGARFNKRRHIHDDIVELLPKTNTAIEAGGFAGIGVNGLTNPYDRLSFRVDVLHDIGNAHE